MFSNYKLWITKYWRSLWQIAWDMKYKEYTILFLSRNYYFNVLCEIDSWKYEKCLIQQHAFVWNILAGIYYHDLYLISIYNHLDIDSLYVFSSHLNYLTSMRCQCIWMHNWDARRQSYKIPTLVQNDANSSRLCCISLWCQSSFTEISGFRISPIWTHLN